MNFLLDQEIRYKETYCKCIKTNVAGPWCSRWSYTTSKSFCVLNGSLASKFCPGAMEMILNGRAVDDFISSDTYVCNKSLGMDTMITLD